MRGSWWVALGALLCLMLAACSPPNESKKAEAPAAAKDEPPPAVFQATLDTSKGPVAIEVRRDWAPRGADHFYELVKTGFYDGNRFFRVVRNFVVQFGISGDPQLNRLWADAKLPDDPVKHSNVKGTLTYAQLGPNSRTTQLFINLKDNKSLDRQGFAPIGKVISGMDTVERLYSSYGEMAPRGQGPDPSQIEVQGNAYLEDHFARLDYIHKATIR
jgi:peptidyl-prolyl cis-trans isomerase A (cyclophilin A)